MPICKATCASMLLFFSLFGVTLAQSPALRPTDGEVVGEFTAEEFVESRISRVTLYRDQALVTRTVTIPAGERVRELRIRHLPEQVVVDSVYADSSDSVDVQSVRVTQQAVFASDENDVDVLSKQAAELNLQRQQVNHQLQIVSKQAGYIDQLMNFTLDASHADRNQGVLNSGSLTETTEYGLEKQQVLLAAKAKFEQELAEIETQDAQIQEKSRLLSQPTGTRYEVRLLVANQDPAQPSTVELSYLVSGCRWSPQYTIRGELGSDNFDLRYKALVEQMSGEDWEKVQLTLSTASPSLGASGPSLTPFRVSVGPAGGGLDGSQQAAFGSSGFGTGVFGDYESESYGGASAVLQAPSKTLLQRKEQANSQVASQQSQIAQRDIELNGIASEVQNLELSADAEQLKTLASDANADVSSQTYAIGQTVSLDSRREQQLVTINNSQLKGELYHVATPLLSSFAYREADIINDQPLSLLRGPATVYLDGRFVGRLELPSIAIGQHMIVGFGADNQVRTRRELLSKQDEIQGGNRKLTFAYRLVVANFKDTPVRLRLVDRLPLAQTSADVSIQPLDFQEPLSEDGLYQRIDKQRGILRWDLDVPGEQFGEKAFDVDYRFSLEFDRNRGLASLLSPSQVATDYQETAVGVGMGGMGGGMGGMGGSMGGLGGK